MAMTFDRAAYMQEYQRAYMPAYREAHVKELRRYDRNRYLEAKGIAFAALGGRCCLCGEDEQEFLTVDHVSGDGCQGRRGRREVYLSISRGTGIGSSRLLCRSCSFGLSTSKIKENAPSSKHDFSGPVCAECGNLKLVRTSNHPKYGTRKRTECRFCRRTKDYELRLLAMEALGGLCACCAEDDMVKLTVDHVQNDGGPKRRIDHVGTAYFYRKVISRSVDLGLYQVLCWNCNFSKHLGGGLCVHQREEVKE